MIYTKEQAIIAALQHLAQQEQTTQVVNEIEKLGQDLAEVRREAAMGAPSLRHK